MTETESRPRNRALVASFLFTDLVGYSKGTASDQFAAKSALSDILGAILPALRKDDYQVKDTGDGALIAFLSSPEHALYVALAMVTDFARASAAGGFPSNSLRTGLHIGAVKEAMDLEARPNFVGDGINAAKRIMDFAAPGQITASRSYFEAVSWLDAAYGSMFHHLGASDDKHGRAHDLYEIVPDAAVLAKLRTELAPASSKTAPTAARDAAANATANETQSPITTPSARATEPSRTRHWTVALGMLAFGAVSLSIYLGTRSPAAVAPPGAGEAISGSPREVPLVAAQPAPVINGTAPSTAPPRSDPVPSKQAAQSPAPGVAIDSASSNGAAEVGTSALLPRAMTRDSETEAAPVQPKIERSESATNGAPSRTASTATGAPPSVVDPKRKHAESVIAPSAGASTVQSSARCRSIVEKAAVGEPLSPDEKRELANTCR